MTDARGRARVRRAAEAMPQLSIHGTTQGALLERLSAERPDRVALVHPRRGLRLTFRDLDERSMALARGLLALGVRSGERVVVWSDNRPDWVPLQFALARIGAVLVTANTALAEEEIGYLLRQSRSAAIVAAPGLRGTEYRDALANLRARTGSLPELRHTILLEGEPVPGMLTLTDVVERGGSVSAEEVRKHTRATRVEDPANIQYTSGTTGFPKGAVLTHRNLVENAWTLARSLEVRDDDRMLLQVPLFHCFGCVVSVLGAFTHGIPLIVLDRFDPLHSLEAIHEERATIVHGVPTMFRAMLEHPERSRFDTSSLRTGIMAGAMCPEPLMRRVIDELGCEGMVVAYGLTEASPAITNCRPDDPIAVRCGSVGRALPGVDVRIVDPATDKDVARGERGEIQARGPNVMAGYFEMPDATAQAIAPGGWLRTGDLGTMDSEGLVRIVGRIKELIIRGGENVSPAEVEDALRGHPAVQDAAVFGVPSDHWGEEVAAAVVLRPGASVEADELVASLEGRIARFKRPERIAFLPSLPLTPSGKVQKFKLPELCGFVPVAEETQRSQT